MYVYLCVVHAREYSCHRGQIQFAIEVRGSPELGVTESCEPPKLGNKL